MPVVAVDVARSGDGPARPIAVELCAAFAIPKVEVGRAPSVFVAHIDRGLVGSERPDDVVALNDARHRASHE